MAKQQSVARKQSRLKRDQQQDTDVGSQNGHDEEIARYEQELADYLLERIKPGLNRGAIPLLARSIAREVARWEVSNGDEADEEPEADAEELTDEPQDEVDAEGDEDTDESEDTDEPEDTDESEDADEPEDTDEPEAEGEDDSDFEADMHDLQAELGEDWILRFSVHGDDAWLTAEKDDGSQRLEAPNASVLVKAVKLLDKAV